jgi:hypothetical protein
MITVCMMGSTVRSLHSVPASTEDVPHSWPTRLSARYVLAAAMFALRLGRKSMRRCGLIDDSRPPDLVLAVWKCRLRMILGCGFWSGGALFLRVVICL